MKTLLLIATLLTTATPALANDWDGVGTCQQTVVCDPNGCRTVNKCLGG